MVVEKLMNWNVFSAYHTHLSQDQGMEERPTYFMYRHKDKSYHIDYCFVSTDIAEKLQSVEVGDYDFWTKYSDHVPLIITIANT